jgi:hypothetical protein
MIYLNSPAARYGILTIATDPFSGVVESPNFRQIPDVLDTEPGSPRPDTQDRLWRSPFVMAPNSPRGELWSGLVSLDKQPR